MKVKFKYHQKTTGLARAGNTTNRGCDIIFGKEIIGSITDHDGFQIRLKIIKQDINEDGNPNSKWKWIKLKKVFSDLDDAKNFVRENFDILNEVYPICYED